MGKERKTGQGIDTIKDTLLAPVLTNRIMSTLVEKRLRTPNILDLGPGDASYTAHIYKALIQRGVAPSEFSLIEIDTNMLPEIISTFEPMSHLFTGVIDHKSRSAMHTYTSLNSNRFDIALSQLTFHQMLSDAELTHTILQARKLLTEDGDFFIVDLHPDYIRYLHNHEKGKLNVRKSGEDLVGRYNFDTGGSAPLRNRELKNITAHMAGLGFDLTHAENIHTDKIAGLKPRYRELGDSGIPMFYLLQFNNPPKRHLSSTTGTIVKVAELNEDQVTIELIDGDLVTIPKFKGFQDARPGDVLELLEIYRKDIDLTILNTWIIPEKVSEREIIWDQSMFKPQRR